MKLEESELVFIPTDAGYSAKNIAEEIANTVDNYTDAEIDEDTIFELLTKEDCQAYVDGIYKNIGNSQQDIDDTQDFIEKTTEAFLIKHKLVNYDERK